MIMQPSMVTKETIKAAIAAVRCKMALDCLGRLRFEALEEGY